MQDLVITAFIYICLEISLVLALAGTTGSQSSVDHSVPESMISNILRVIGHLGGPRTPVGLVSDLGDSAVLSKCKTIVNKLTGHSKTIFCARTPIKT